MKDGYIIWAQQKKKTWTLEIPTFFVWKKVSDPQISCWKVHVPTFSWWPLRQSVHTTLNRLGVKKTWCLIQNGNTLLSQNILNFNDCWLLACACNKLNKKTVTVKRITGFHGTAFLPYLQKCLGKQKGNDNVWNTRVRFSRMSSNHWFLIPDWSLQWMISIWKTGGCSNHSNMTRYCHLNM